MKFGVITPNLNSPAKISEFAKAAEDAGFDHFLLSDHYFIDEYRDMLDSWALIGHLSGLTSTLRLGTCVTPINFRPPLQFAKVVTTLDHASNGRIVVGVGAGWYKSEFEMYSQYYPNKERFQQFREALDLITKAWTDASVSFSGKYYSASKVIMEPKPVQKPYPPLLFGGWGDGMVRLAGKRGDAWTPTGPRSGEAVKSPEEYARFVGMIEKGLHERGIAHYNFQFGCRFGPMDDSKEYGSEVDAYAKVGLNCYQLGVNVDKHSSTTLREFGDSVIANY